MLLHPVERRGGVAQLALAVVEHALRAADAAEVEAQHREPAPHEHVEQGVDDLVVHRPAMLRVRMQDHGERCRRPLAVDVPPFQPTVGAVEDDFRHYTFSELTRPPGRPVCCGWKSALDRPCTAERLARRDA